MARQQPQVLHPVTCHARRSWHGDLPHIPGHDLLDSITIVIRTRTVYGPVCTGITMTEVLSLVCYVFGFALKLKLCFALLYTCKKRVSIH